MRVQPIDVLMQAFGRIELVLGPHARIIDTPATPNAASPSRPFLASPTFSENKCGLESDRVE